MFVLIAICMWACLWFVARRMRNHLPHLTPALGFFVGLLFFVAVPTTVIVLGGGYKLAARYGASDLWASVDLRNWQYFQPTIIIFAVLLLCATAIAISSSKAAFSAKPLQPDRSRIKRALKITMIVAVLEWIATIWYFGGLLSFLATHWYLRGEELHAQYGEGFTLFLHVSLANQIIFTSAALLFAIDQLRSGKYDRRFSILLAAFFLLSMVMSGNRIFIAIFLIGFFTAAWVYGKYSVLRRLLWISPVIIVVFALWASVRHNLTAVSESVANLSDAGALTEVQATFMDATEGIDALLLFHILRDFGATHELLHGQSYVKGVAFFFPRSIYPNKPPPVTEVMAKLYEPGETTSLNPTAIGESWANFGVATLLFLPLVVVLTTVYGNRAIVSGLDPLTAMILFVMMIWCARIGFAENIANVILAIAEVKLLRLSTTSPASWKTQAVSV